MTAHHSFAFMACGEILSTKNSTEKITLPIHGSSLFTQCQTESIHFNGVKSYAKLAQILWNDVIFGRNFENPLQSPVNKKSSQNKSPLFSKCV